MSLSHIQFFVRNTVLVILWKRQFYFCTVAHVLVVESANKLAKVLEHVLWSKKYKKSFWKFSQEGCQLSTLPSKLEYFAVTAVIRELVIGWANKLAEVLEHVLGVKIPKRVFENSVGKASNDEAKIRTQQNSQLQGRIATVPPHRRPKLFCFSKKPMLSSLKLVVGRHTYDVAAESCILKTEITRTFEQDCIYIT